MPAKAGIQWVRAGVYPRLDRGRGRADQGSKLDRRLVAVLDALGDPLLHPARDRRAVMAEIHEIRAVARQCIVDAVIDEIAARPSGDELAQRGIAALRLRS